MDSSSESLVLTVYSFLACKYTVLGSGNAGVVMCICLVLLNRVWPVNMLC